MYVWVTTMAETITPYELLLKQDKLKQLQEAQARAWSKIGAMEAEVKIAKERYDNARFDAENCLDELNEMQKVIRAQGTFDGRKRSDVQP